MAAYLPPTKFSNVFNFTDFNLVHGVQTSSMNTSPLIPIYPEKYKLYELTLPVTDSSYQRFGVGAAEPGIYFTHYTMTCTEEPSPLQGFFFYRCITKQVWPADGLFAFDTYGGDVDVGGGIVRYAALRCSSTSGLYFQFAGNPAIPAEQRHNVVITAYTTKFI